MTDANFFHLCQELQIKVQLFLKQVNDAIVPSHCKITTTYRTPEEQADKYMHGISNAHPGESPHECCLPNGSPASKAFDWSIIDENGHYISDGTDNRYTIAGHIAEGLGLDWGGRWHHPDFDHAQMKNWR